MSSMIFISYKILSVLKNEESSVLYFYVCRRKTMFCFKYCYAMYFCLVKNKKVIFFLTLFVIVF